jgi:hypothetical protein
MKAGKEQREPFPLWEPRRVAVAILAMTFLAGCATLPPLPPVDLSAPGWTIRHGQAVWRFDAKAPEVVGDLVVAAGADGRLFAQFSKGPVTVAVARADQTQWELDLDLFDRRIRRRGTPDKRFALFQLARQCAGGEIPAPWRASRDTGSRWRLENPRTGEYLEGYWEP